MRKMWTIINSCAIFSTTNQAYIELSNDFCYNTDNMPKRTYQPHTRHRAKTHGYRARRATKAGRRRTQARQAKGRARIAL